MHDPTAAEPVEDDALVAGFAAGTSRGLEEVYAAYGRRLYSAARHVLGSDDDAQDCVHDTLVRLWQRPGSYRRERGPLRTFLLVAVRNEALSRKRSAARHLALERRASAGERDRYELETSDPVTRARLRDAIAALPADQRAALELAYFGECTHVQVAERLGAPLGTVKSRLALALRKLNAALTAGGAGPA